MKKIFSLLLVALLLVGMLPATAIHSHAADLSAELSFASKNNRTSFSTTQQIWEQNGITFINNKSASTNAVADYANPVRLYQNSEIVVEAPGNITSIEFAASESKYATAMKNSVSGSTISGNNVTVTLDGTAKTFTVAKLTAQVRLSKITVTYANAESGDDSCTHANTVPVEAVPPTCTNIGYTAGVKCVDCGEVIEGVERVDALGHNETSDVTAPTCTADGFTTYTCSVCGNERKADYVDATGHTMVDGTCTVCGVEQANLQKASAIAIGDQIIFVCETKNVELNGFYSTSYAYGTDYTGAPLGAYPWTVEAGASDGTFAFKNSDGKYLSWTSSNSAKTVASIDANASWTVSFDANGNAIVANAKDATRKLQWNASSPRFACYTTAQTAIQIYSFAADSEGGEPENPEPPACTHQNTTTTTVNATCTKAGSVTVTCDSCGETISTQEIPVIDHTYVDGFCSCGKAEPELTYTRYYIAAKRTATGSKLYYMTNALTTTSTKRYAVVATELTEVPEKITNAEANMVFVLVDDGSGTYKIYAEGIDGDNKYLGWTSDNSGALVTEANAKKVTVVYNQDGSVKISFVDGDGYRKLTLNNNTGSDYFAWYGTEQANVYLIPVSDECVHENTTTNTVNADCVNPGSETVICDDCGETVSTKVIDALGHYWTAEETKPTCTQQGYTTVFCDRCGDIEGIEDYVDALGHSYNAVVTAPTAIKDGYTTFTCSVCGDSYVGNTVPAIGIGELKFCGGSIVLEDDLTVRYLVNKTLFIEDAYTNPYVVFTIGNKTQIVTNYQVLDNYYAFDCTDIAPSQLGDVVTGTMYAYLNNMEYSVAATYSVAEYCYNILAETNDAKLKTLIVDLLNYGSASQQYVWYKDKTLSNANLTDEQKAYASTDSELVSALKTDYAVVDNASAKWTGATLVLQNNVCIRFRFAADNLDGLSVKIVAAGQEWTVTKFEPAGVEGQYYAFFDGLKAHQMSEDVFATVYADGVAVSNTVRYSIESYAYTMQNDANVRLANLVKAMMRYGKSAAAYLN